MDSQLRPAASKNVLITGARGLLGSYIAKTLASGGFQVLRTATVEAPGVDQVLDFPRLPARDLSAHFEKHKVGTVVHLAAWSNVDECERNPTACMEYNVGHTRRLVAAANDTGARFVFASTNAVYDGLGAPYAETAPRKPTHVYGTSKKDAEDLVGAEAQDHLIFRFILSFGVNPPGARENPLTQILSAYRAGKRELRMVDDVFANTLYAGDAAEAVRAALTKGIKNDVFNVAGSTRQSRYDLALSIKRVFGLSELAVQAVASTAFPGLVKRPPDTSFDCGKMASVLGVKPRAIDKALELCRAEMRL